MGKTLGTMNGFGNGQEEFHPIPIPEEMLKLFNLSNPATFKDKNVMKVIHKILVMSFEFMGDCLTEENLKEYTKFINTLMRISIDHVFNPESVFADPTLGNEKDLEEVMRIFTDIIQDLLNTVEFVRLYRANLTIDSFNLEFINCRTINYS